MAISSAAKSGISTFARYQKASTGNVAANGVFAFADTTSTYRVSADGLTWTSYTTPSSVTGMYLTYHSAAKGWQWWAGSGVGSIMSFNKNLLTPKLDGYTNSSITQASADNGFFQLVASDKTYVGATSASVVFDEGYAWHMRYSSAPYSGVMCRPAWDGVSTWAVLTSNGTSHWARYTTQAVSGSGIMPLETDGAGQGGWSAWSTYTPPASNYFRDMIYWSGYWYVRDDSMNVYRTANIATASPSWTNVGTLTNVNSPMFIVNNELWILSGGYSSAAAWKLTTPTGSFSSVTLPSAKQSNSIAYGNGTYVIFNGDGTVFRSTTGASSSFSSVSTGSTASYASRLTGGFGPDNG